MDLQEILKKRVSIRKFVKETVPESVIKKALGCAVLAPNSSNLQPWEFYWVRSDKNKKLLRHACLDQSAATTAAELIVAVSRIDTWKRNRDLLIQDISHRGAIPDFIKKYYQFVVPFAYAQDFFGLIGFIKKMILVCVGAFRPIARKPAFRSELFEVVSKTTALACENFMLSISEDGYDSCPMEGFDEKMVKKILKLNRSCHVVMVIAVGKRENSLIPQYRYRLPNDLVIFEV